MKERKREAEMKIDVTIIIMYLNIYLFVNS